MQRPCRVKVLIEELLIVLLGFSISEADDAAGCRGELGGQDWVDRTASDAKKAAEVAGGKM